MRRGFLKQVRTMSCSLFLSFQSQAKCVEDITVIQYILVDIGGALNMCLTIQS